MTQHAQRIWLGIGMAGQVLFFLRFFVQWLATEKNRKVTVPHIFWHLSIAGGLVLLAYALYRRDPVFIVGQGMGLLVYGRNLYFHYKGRE